LNDVVCIAEGRIGVEGMEIHLFAGVDELARLVAVERRPARLFCRPLRG